MSQGENVILVVILVVVDRFTEFGHFKPLSHPYIAFMMANMFLNHVFKLHGFPRTIITDRDLVFVSFFRKVFFLVHGCTLNHNSAYHLQTDGQT